MAGGASLRRGRGRGRCHHAGSAPADAAGCVGRRGWGGGGGGGGPRQRAAAPVRWGGRGNCTRCGSGAAAHVAAHAVPLRQQQRRRQSQRRAQRRGQLARSPWRAHSQRRDWRSASARRRRARPQPPPRPPTRRQQRRRALARHARGPGCLRGLRPQEPHHRHARLCRLSQQAGRWGRQQQRRRARARAPPSPSPPPPPPPPPARRVCLPAPAGSEQRHRVPARGGRCGPAGRGRRCAAPAGARR